jgi:hypothetical protein
MDAIDKAVATLSSRLLANSASNATLVCRGLVEKSGHLTGDEGVVVYVDEKLSADQVRAEGVVPIPECVEVDGQIVRVDVVENPMMHDLRLMLPTGDVAESLAVGAFAGEDHRRCFDEPCPVGLQVAPKGAGWVGTSGLPCVVPSKGIVGFVTNWHVAVGGQFDRGATICQPHGDGPGIGTLADFAPIDFRGGVNSLDLALVDDRRRSDGKSLTKPESFGLGRFVNSPAHLKLRDLVAKSGRTTGRRIGMVIGVNATSHVNYGENGVATFGGQVVIRDVVSGEDFSGPGDSGSGIVAPGSGDGSSLADYRECRPAALLFAGGGGRTIANPVAAILARYPDIRFD